MMNYFLRWPTILLLLMVNTSWACVEETLKSHEREIKVCYNPKDRSVYSKSCKSSSNCLKVKDLSLSMYPNQSPGFSICYQQGGKPFFGEFKGKRYSFCEKDDLIVDTESLLRLLPKD